MYQHRFFVGFKKERARFLAAKEFADLPVGSVIQSRLDQLIDELKNPRPLPKTAGQIWLKTLAASKAFILLSIFSNLLIGTILFVSIMASRHVLESIDLKSALIFAGIFFFAELSINIIRYFEFNRRHRMYRAVQLYHFTIVNQKLLRIDPHLDGEFSKGNLKSIISSDIESIEDFLGGLVAIIIPGLVIGTILGFIVYDLSGRLGLVGIAAALIQIPISMAFAKLIAHYQARAQVAQDNLITLIGEWVRNIRLVRFLGWQPAISKEIERGVRSLTVDSVKRHLLYCATYAVSHCWWMLPIVAMLLTADYMDVKLSLPVFFSSIWALNYFTGQIQYIPYPVSTYGPASTGIRRLAALLGAQEIERNIIKTGREPAQGVPVELKLKHASIAFGEKQALKNISASISLMDKTAIVGSVGSGKSILLDLLCGDRAPSTGSITVRFSSGEEGNLWDDWIYYSYRKHIAYSPQQPFLSNASIRMNIDLSGERNMTEIESAAGQSSMEADISILSNGYEEEVGETGINLSGGQKQRVSLARAFLSGRPIFLLDDPLSAVDVKTEQELMKQIAKKDRGLVLVSHRLDELYLCSRTIVLSDGKIAEDGDTEGLAANPSSLFSQFLRAASEENAA